MESKKRAGDKQPPGVVKSEKAPRLVDHSGDLGVQDGGQREPRDRISRPRVADRRYAVIDSPPTAHNNRGVEGTPGIPEVQQGVVAKTAESGSETILLKFQDQDGSEVRYLMKPTTCFEKAFRRYKQQTEMHLGVRFIFDGQRVQEHETPEKLELEDGDIIEVYIEQTGGA